VSALALLVALLLLVANAFFVATEFALISSRSAKIEALVSEDRRGSRRALSALGDLQRQLGGTQLGITLASLALGLIAEPTVAALIEPRLESIGLAEDLLHPLALTISLAIVVFFHIVLGEMVPKNVAIAGPERTLLLLAPIHHGFVTLTGPIILRLIDFSGIVVRMLGYQVVDELTTANTASEFGRIVDASRRQGLIEELEHAMLTGALDFAGRLTAAAMVPRESLVTVTPRMSAVEVEAVIVSSGLSRLLVVGADTDDVLGFIHAKDLLRLPPEAQDRPLPRELIRTVLVVPQHRSLRELLATMRLSRSHIAVVAGPDGRSLGIVTLEDVLEELVGEIRDESDIEPSPVVDVESM
jgi:CBS domain containing-hemolysin-like protein